MDFASTFKTTIEEAFNKFHSENPLVYEYFKTFALEWIATGAKKISSKQIIGRIRWYVEVEVKGEPFKINDITTAYYARKFVSDYPAYMDKFEFRHLRSA